MVFALDFDSRLDTMAPLHVHSENVYSKSAKKWLNYCCTKISTLHVVGDRGLSLPYSDSILKANCCYCCSDT